jgi:hypothetical protein
MNPLYLVKNSAGEFFVGFVKSDSSSFGKSTRLGGYEPKFMPFRSPGTLALIVDESQLQEMESDLKKFGIEFTLVQVDS